MPEQYIKTIFPGDSHLTSCQQGPLLHQPARNSSGRALQWHSELPTASHQHKPVCPQPAVTPLLALGQEVRDSLPPCPLSGHSNPARVETSCSDLEQGRGSADRPGKAHQPFCLLRWERRPQGSAPGICWEPFLNLISPTAAPAAKLPLL